MSGSEWRKGRFITLEGGEGAGKSSQMKRVVKWIESKGHDVVETREPGGTKVGEALRAVLLDPANTGLRARTEALLMFAARSQHLDEVIQPALDRGAWVVCDRFTDATYAYQGGGRGLGFEAVGVLEEWVQGALRPDLCLLLDISVSDGLLRARARGQADLFERESETFFETVRESYLQRAHAHPDRYAVVDAAPDEQTVGAAITAVLEGWDWP